MRCHICDNELGPGEIKPDPLKAGAYEPCTRCLTAIRNAQVGDDEEAPHPFIPEEDEEGWVSS